MEKFDLLSERLRWAVERKLKANPETKKIPQRRLAEIAGVSAPAVGYWYADTNGIDAEPARKLGAFLGVNPVWLENGEGDPLSATMGQGHPARQSDAVLRADPTLSQIDPHVMLGIVNALAKLSVDHQRLVLAQAENVVAVATAHARRRASNEE